uniref:MOSC domain-containing protein n=1 Tax=Panagrolaimus sp. ES5 TaxID=591445 RepID=A0AC34FNQ3_9BILA
MSLTSSTMPRIYLDHAGATLPSTAQMQEISCNLMADVLRLGNPHSRHQSGETTADIIKQVKESVLSHFGVTSEEHAIIFTKNTSDSLKMVAEIASNIYDKNETEANPNILICVDLASLCSTSPINLQDFNNPDFVALSFYKIFGYPTGIGALLIRKSDKKLSPKGFFGGSVDFYNVETGEFILKENFEQKFEIGTPNYHGIDLLRYGFKDLERFGGMNEIQKHTFVLAKNAYNFLIETKHANNTPIAIVYGWNSFSSIKDQGPIVTFNLKRDDGSFVGYVEVEKMCTLFGIELRTGCFCNQGACNEYLGLQESNNLNIGTSKKCGDEMDVLNGQPLGACRISFGRTSTNQITENNTLQLSDRHGYQDSIELPLSADLGTKSKTTTVCISNYMAIPCGQEASKWLTTLHPTFPKSSQILRLLSETCDSSSEKSTTQNSTFTNEADYLLITWASVNAIAEAVNLPAKDVAQRFRPNFIVETVTNIPFDEDNFSKIYIAGIPFEVISKCTRCQMISIDQESGEKDPKVLLALRDARCGDKVNHGFLGF